MYLFINESYLERSVQRLLSYRRACEFYIKKNREQLLNIETELRFIYEKYDELYPKDEKPERINLEAIRLKELNHYRRKGAWR